MKLESVAPGFVEPRAPAFVTAPSLDVSPAESAHGHRRHSKRSTHSKEINKAIHERERQESNWETRRTSRIQAEFSELESFGETKRGSKWGPRARWAVDNRFSSTFTTLLTVWALTGDDLRLILTDKPVDVLYNVVILVCIFVFALECVLSCIGKEDYRMSFFFWLDLVSTISLLLDITYIAEWLPELLEGGGAEETDNASNLRSGGTARVGAKAGRIVRVIRLVRILKLYKAFYSAEGKNKKPEALPGDDLDWEDLETKEDDEPANVNRESRVGKKLSEMTIRKLILMVLTMLLVFPLLQADPTSLGPTSAAYGAEDVQQRFNRASQEEGSTSAREAYEEALLKYVYYHNWFAANGFCPEGKVCADAFFNRVFWVGVQGRDELVVRDYADKGSLQGVDVLRWEKAHVARDDLFNYGSMPTTAQEILVGPWTTPCSTSGSFRIGFSLLEYEIPGVVSHTVRCPDDLRSVERRKFTSYLQTKAQADKWHFCFYFDQRPYVRADAAYNLGTTGFICFCLVVAAILFSSLATGLILVPVEHMIKQVEAIRNDPLIATKMADNEWREEEIAKNRISKRKRERIKAFFVELFKCKYCQRDSDEPMETVILEKTIVKLGSLLALGFGEAGANIIAANLRGADTAGVNAMIPGVRAECILGVVRISDFSVATEVLQAKIMTFVNQISEIVHGVVDEYHGAANKNYGDKFLVIWILDLTSQTEGTRLAEMSVYALSRILGCLHRSPLLAQYRGHPGLQMRLGRHNRVNLTFGLHSGWAIEGAVGSEFKIDASYLSPNVSIVNAIEQATQIYKVPFIIAQSVFDRLGEVMASKCRMMDTVIITGSVKPIELYSLDLDYTAVKVDGSEPLSIKWSSKQRFRAREFLEKRKQELQKSEISKEFEKDRVILAMRRRYTQKFFQHFNMGFQNYAQGEWAVARRMLADTQCMLADEDGPSTALLRFMEDLHYDPPKEWCGVRELVPPRERRLKG